MPFSENQILILESLAKYKFLTVSQFVELDIYKHASTARTAIISLYDRKRPLVGKVNLNINGTFGHVEKIHYLTQHGANFLMDELNYNSEDIKFPKNLTTMLYRDYYHRRNTVYFAIFLNKWIEKQGFDLYFLDYYFDKDGANRTKQTAKQRLTAKTKVNIDANNYIIPDGAFMFRTEEKPFLCLYEIHQGKDTLKLFRQIEKHLEVIANESAKKKYKLPVNNRTLIIFELESAKKSAIKRLKEIQDIQNFDRFLLFASIEDLEKSFFSGWCNIYGQQTNFI